ncbi:MAG: FtsX-like permease family protein [Pseudomonadales bacterium]|nr:FtsX-like permease family protein [Pseudomonadales bacterium]
MASRSLNSIRKKIQFLRLNQRLAWRFFGGGRQDALVSMISTISIVGMMVAVSVLVLVLSVMNGFEREFRDRILGMVPHARVWFEQPQLEADSLVERLEQEPGVISVLPFSDFKALATVGTQAQPILVQGTDIKRFKKIGHDYLVADATDTQREELGPGDVIVGAALAKKLGVRYGEHIRLMVVQAQALPADQYARNGGKRQRTKTSIHSLRVSGLLRTGTELDQSIALISLSEAARIQGTNNTVQGVQLQFADVFAARSEAERVAIKYGLTGRSSDWTREYGNLYTAIQLSRQLVVLLLTSIIAVAVFNVFITLGMVVRHKRPEIAILRSMGVPQRHILQVFVWQGLLISVLGCCLGLALGCALAWLAPSIVDLLQQSLGYEFLSTDIYPIDYLPSQILVGDLLLISGTALSMSLLGTLIPAWRAAQLKPASVLNGQER